MHDISTNKSDFVTENEKRCEIPKHPRFPLCSLKIQVSCYEVYSKLAYYYYYYCPQYTLLIADLNTNT